MLAVTAAMALIARLGAAWDHTFLVVRFCITPSVTGQRTSSSCQTVNTVLHVPSELP